MCIENKQINTKEEKKPKNPPFDDKHVQYKSRITQSCILVSIPFKAASNLWTVSNLAPLNEPIETIKQQQQQQQQQHTCSPETLSQDVESEGEQSSCLLGREGGPYTGRVGPYQVLL